VRCRWIKRERDVGYRMGQPCLSRIQTSFIPIWYNLFDGKGQPYSCTLIHIRIHNLSPLVEQKRRVDNYYLCVTGTSYYKSTVPGSLLEASWKVSRFRLLRSLKARYCRSAKHKTQTPPPPLLPPSTPSSAATSLTELSPQPSPPSEMPDLGATDPADLEAKARAELVFF